MEVHAAKAGSLFRASDQEFHKVLPAEEVVQLKLSLTEWAKDSREGWNRILDRGWRA
jgi:hypothetical protein